MISIGDFEACKDELIELLGELVELESPSDDKAGVDRVGKRVLKELRHLGAEVQVDQQRERGNNLIARLGMGEKNGILLLCHMDTVYPTGTLERQPFYEKDGAIYGPGTLDMKGGIAMLLTVLKVLKEKDRLRNRPLTALFTSDEEVGSQTSRSLIENLAGQSTLVLCLEPGLPDGALKTWRKGIGDFDIVVTGRAAHAGGEHEKGLNAIEELAHHVLAVQKLTDYSKGTTINVGMIQGGTARNVIPEQARATVDVRVLSLAEGERVEMWLKSIKPVLDGTRVEISGGINRPPMPRDERMVQTFSKARSIASRLGVDLIESGTGGGSDANFVAPLGIPVLDGLGPQGSGAHSEREQVVSSTLAARTAILAALLTEW